MADKQPIKMLHDRILCELDARGRRAALLRRHRHPRHRRHGRAPARLGPGRRGRPARPLVEVGDRVLFDPDDKAEVEVHGEIYVVMRERDVHAVAADRLADESAGLYL